MANVLPPPPIQDQPGAFTWLEWYRQLRAYVSQSGSVPWSVVDKAGSDLADLQTRSHQSLQNVQGGSSGQYYHLTSAQQAAIASGLTVTITTAKLTAGGTDGSMTFTNGILTAHTQAT